MPSAAEQLERILYVLPRAAREGGASLEELSRLLGVEPEAVIQDLTEVTNRAFYHPAGSGADLQIEVSSERVSVWTTGQFQRPTRLSMPEAVCLGLALRGGLAGRWDGPAAGEDTGTEPAAWHLLEGLEAALSSVPAEDALACFEAEDLRPDPAGLRELLAEAVEARESCRIRYLKPGAEEPEDRTVRPYALVHGEGHWYLVGHCELSEGVRIFRLDRVLDAEPQGECFEVPADFDPEDYVQGGRVFRAERSLEVKVRFTPRVARWIAERHGVKAANDGSLTVTYEVADPHWLVRHVLQYGPDAEVLEPPEARGWMREAVG